MAPWRAKSSCATTCQITTRTMRRPNQARSDGWSPNTMNSKLHGGGNRMASGADLKARDIREVESSGCFSEETSSGCLLNLEVERDARILDVGCRYR